VALVWGVETTSLRESYFGDACFKYTGELPGRNRPAEIIALSFVTFVGFKELHLSLGFDPFRNNTQLQASAHGDDSLYGLLC
jgi:hypothetical protein